MPTKPGVYATFKTSQGTIVAELFETDAPQTVANFIGLAEGSGMGGPGYRFADETRGSRHGFQDKGKLAMANAGPNTNGSQFFITVAPTTWLTGKHTIFGEVVEGYDVVEKISKVARDGMDRPKTPVVLESVTIQRIS